MSYCGYNKYDINEHFGSLSISDRNKVCRKRCSHSNQLFDKNYFPKYKAVKCFYSRGICKPFWVQHPDDAENNPFELIQIYSQNGRNKEFRNVTSAIRNSFNFSIVIHSVYKAYNDYLKCQYLLKKLEKETYKNCTEIIMYHATKKENIEDILTHNFNWRYSGESRGSKYGIGVNFTPEPYFAHQFCKDKNLKVLIVSKVLVGSTYIGTSNLILPKNGFDTTCSPKKTVYVKFEDSEFYPKYIVYYSRTA